jgi:hypothetical protein
MAIKLDKFGILHALPAADADMTRSGKRPLADRLLNDRGSFNGVFSDDGDRRFAVARPASLRVGAGVVEGAQHPTPTRPKRRPG